MKKTIILISISILVFAGILLPNETRIPDPVPVSKIMEISGKINAIMTDIPTGQPTSSGPPVAFVKIKIKDGQTGQEHSIQVAPGHFLRLKGIMIQKDDQVKIKVFKPENSPEIKSMQIEVKGKVLILRDRFGKGLWEKPQIRAERREHTIR
ncbi:MAG: hypothetical protein ABFR36_09875 [Acidobacteriota bacterium]